VDRAHGSAGAVSFLYEAGKRAILDHGDALAAQSWRVALLSPEYEPDPFDHATLGDVGEGVLVGTLPLTGLYTEQMLEHAAIRVLADDLHIVGLPAGRCIGFIVTYVEPHGVLISCQSDGLPLVTNGGDIRVCWDRRNGIFSVAMYDVAMARSRSPERSPVVRPNRDPEPEDAVILPFPTVALGRFDGLDDEEEI
jgi:hypothetical protein